MSQVISAVMVLSAIAVLLALFIPGLFTAWANRTLENSGTLESIRKIDGSMSIEIVKEGAQSIWGQITGIFGVTPTQTPAPNQAKAGILEEKLYPELRNALAGLYRTITIIVGLVVMGVSVYFAYATSGLAEVSSLEKRIQVLEAKLSAK